MPTKFPSPLAILTLRASVGLGPANCCLCHYARLARRIRAGGEPARINARGPSRYARFHTTGVSPATSIGTPNEATSHEYETLLSRLKSLGAAGSIFVDASRLQLALRSLKSRDSVIRIAVNGLTDPAGPRKLAWALLADPLGESAGWERALQDVENDDRPVLLRYNEIHATNTNNPLYRTLSIPSTWLKHNRIELLIFGPPPLSSPSLNEGGIVTSSSLVPTFDMRNSASGRLSNITFPTHCTIYLSSGPDGILSIARVLQSLSDLERRMMTKGIASVQWPNPQATSQDDDIWFVNLDEADKAISLSRSSPSSINAFEHAWTGSGLSAVSDFCQANARSEATLKPAVRALVLSLLARAEDAVRAEEANAIRDLKSRTVPETLRSAMRDSISTWAEAAHTELRDELENIFAGRSWRKLGWWKLPWRVDDVGMIVSETLQRAYLLNAEKSIIFLWGRIRESGLLMSKVSLHRPQEPQSPSSPNAQLAQTIASSVTRKVASSEHLPLEADPQQPWPQDIALSRAGLLATSVQPLQARAQLLFLQALITTSMTSSLSALLYLGSPTIGIYEASTVGVAGLAWSAWRMQRAWERAKGGWIDRVKEEGRNALTLVERRFRLSVETGGRASEDIEATENRRRTRDAIESVRSALNELA